MGIKKKSHTVVVSDKCPHCEEAIAFNVIVDNNKEFDANQKLIDVKNSIMYQQLADNYQSGDLTPEIFENIACPNCQGIILCLEVSNVTIINIKMK